MGSVMDYMDCPQCGGSETMFRDYYYKSGEEYWMCKRCGKHGKVVIVRDDEGNAIFDKNGRVSFREEDLKGYGCAKIAVVGHGATLSCFTSPITEDDKKKQFSLVVTIDTAVVARNILVLRKIEITLAKSNVSLFYKNFAKSNWDSEA